MFSQARKACTPFCTAVPGIVRESMARIAHLTGRRDGPFDYTGAPDAERVLVQMGSGTGASREAVGKIAAAGERVGLGTVLLYRPFDVPAFLPPLPKTVRAIAALDRTREPGAIGEPPYQSVVTALDEGWPNDLPRAGADCVTVASCLPRNGPAYAGRLVRGVRDRMAERECASAAQMQGSLSQQSRPDPGASERTNDMKALTSCTSAFV